MSYLLRRSQVKIMRPLFYTRLLMVFVFFTADISLSFADEIPRHRLLHLLDNPRLNESLDGAGYKGAYFRVFKDDDVASPTFGTELCVFETPSNSARLRVKALQINGLPKNIYEKSFPHKTLCVINGGFFGVSNDGKSIPLGLVKSDGKLINKRHAWTSGGMVVASEQAVKIIPVRFYKDSPTWINVIQSKPLLVYDGRDGIRSSNFDRFDRSAVAITTKGEVVFFIIYEPGGMAASLAEFSQLLMKYRTTNGNAIFHALALDGGPGTHLFIPALKKHYGANTPNFIPNVLYLSK